jgi:putative transposase
MPDILPILLTLSPVLSKTMCRQLHVIVEAMLAMTGRITQRGIARWAGRGGSYRTVHRFFQTQIDWTKVKWHFFELFVCDPKATYLLAGDETVVSKAGKGTHGLDRFFSSLAAKPIPGIACFSLALVHVGKRAAYSLSEEQVIRTPEEKEQIRKRKEEQKKRAAAKGQGPKKPRGRPKGSKNKNKAEVTLSPELLRILEQVKTAQKLFQTKLRVAYFVLDGHFGNHLACQMVRQLGMHLISRMRSDAALWLEPTEREKKEHPRLKYGARLDYKKLPNDRLCSEVTEEGYCTRIYHMTCLHKEFAERLNIVIIVRTHLASGRVGHVVLMSSDLTLSWELLVDYYKLRFQIEFTFRDAKQHFGLEDFMGVGETSVANGFGLAFFVGNVARYLREDFRERCPGAGLSDLRSFYRGRHYLQNLLKLLPDQPDGIVCERLLEQMSALGSIHGHSRTASELEMAA